MTRMPTFNSGSQVHYSFLSPSDKPMAYITYDTPASCSIPSVFQVNDLSSHGSSGQSSKDELEEITSFLSLATNIVKFVKFAAVPGV